MTLPLKIIAIVLLSYSVSLAEFSSPHCPSILNSNFLVASDVSCTTLKDFNSIYTTLKEIADFPSEYPRVFINKNSYNGWTTFGNLMYLDEDQMLFGEKRENSKRRLIWLHEMGHLVFQELLQKDFPELKCFIDYMKKDADLKWLAKDPLLNTDKNLETFFTMQCGQAREIQKPYTELFADFMMALAASDTSAPFEAYHTAAVPLKDLARFKLGSFAKKSSVSTCTNSDEHTFFTSVRYKIGQKILKSAKTNSEKKMAISQFYKILSDDLLAYWKKNKLLPDCKIANQNQEDRLSQKTK